MEMIGQLVGTLFLSREVAHRAHLAVKPVMGSFAMHTSLGEFYNSVIEKADRLTEVYQGRMDTLIEIPYLDFPKSENLPKDILGILEDHLDDIESLRYTAVDKKETMLQNLIDEIVELYSHTFYKLRNFR